MTDIGARVPDPTLDPRLDEVRVYRPLPAPDPDTRPGNPVYPVGTDTFATLSTGLTPSQTVGPYWAIGLFWPDGASVAPVDAPGAVELAVTVIDGAGDPVADALIETWQADAAGRFDHPDDPRGAAPSTPAGFRGFGRAIADSTGTAVLRTVKPGSLPAEDGLREAPHIDVGVFARGMVERLVTRIYFPDEVAANADDPVLQSIPSHRRDGVIATVTADGFAHTIYVQDSDPTGRETPFFDL